MASDYPVLDDRTRFRSLYRDNLSFGDVYNSILGFIRADKNSSYRISIGSDSQTAGNRTVCVSCIHIHRVGMGAIGFLKKSVVHGYMGNLHEKIYLETWMTMQLAYLFEGEKIEAVRDLLGPKVIFEFHIDIGTNGPTKALIKEMTGMVKGLDFIPKIKPESYCASCFADRYTKAM
ncbi:MAG: ribonuclease H-like YkuK family protein [Eubacteriales bacterium]|nr:ribonuclease H-like YkuK family protein [Eubacteriales bacterium]